MLGGMVLVLKLQLRPGKVCSACEVCMGAALGGERADPWGWLSESKYLPWLCSRAELGFLSPFYLPWGRRRLSSFTLLQQHRAAQRKHRVRKWASLGTTRVLPELWGWRYRSVCLLHTSLRPGSGWVWSERIPTPRHPGCDGMNLFLRAGATVCILSSSVVFSGDTLSNTEMWLRWSTSVLRLLQPVWIELQ